MRYEISFVDLQTQPAAVVSGHVPHDGIPAFLGTAYTEVARSLAEQGMAPAGPPFARYRPSDDGGWVVDAGFPVPRAVTASGGVRPAELPGGRVARTLHVGPYEGLANAYEATMSYLVDEGYVPAGAPWETYLDEPGVPAPRTELFVPCSRARAHAQS
jgi:effector-binding domain-containing protein